MRSALLLVVTAGLCAAGCAPGSVGDPCLPEHVPNGGFDSAETFVESGSSECASRVCIVRGLDGDPRADCTSDCASEGAIDEHVYCTCRCDDGGPAPACACPDGFRCEDTGALGSYCVRD